MGVVSIGLFVGVHLVCFAVISGLAALIIADPDGVVCFVVGLVSLSRLSRLKNCFGWNKNWLYPYRGTRVYHWHDVAADQS